MKKYVLLIALLLLFSPVFVAHAQEGVIESDGYITGYFYNPGSGSVAPKVDDLTFEQSQDFLAGEEITAEEPGDVAEAPAEEEEEDGGKEKKEKSNNGIGWGVGGNPEEKTEADGSDHMKK
ncbi:MAG: hypothetical protein ABH872_06830 [Candidatus Omnitrophota bacterium]